MTEAIVAWLPVIIIALAIGYAGRQSMKSYAGHVSRIEAMNNDLVDQNGEILAELREIKQLLKDQK
jgi:hypothetical protein